MREQGSGPEAALASLKPCPIRLLMIRSGCGDEPALIGKSHADGSAPESDHMPDRHRRRAGVARVAGRRRSIYLAGRIGTSLKDSRLALRLTQEQASERAGISQGFWSALENGRGMTASLETLAACAAAVDTQLASFIEARPGSDLPRDIAHLRGQEAIVRWARPGGWTARVEHGIDPMSRRSRSVDVILERRTRRQIAIVELVDLLVDGGEAMRGLSDKVAAIRRQEPRATVAGLLVIRATARNRAIVRELAGLMQARFAGGSRVWVDALRDPNLELPTGDGVAWMRVDGSSLYAARLHG
jgi:transcriptional regulator with XRE-family HTH domain